MTEDKVIEAIRGRHALIYTDDNGKEHHVMPYKYNPETQQVDFDDLKTRRWFWCELRDLHPPLLN